jgi:predicted HAD superfamily Cof-like phosphohydrolase
MSKLWPDGTPHYKDDGKTLKPPGWQDPEPLLREAIDRKRESINGQKIDEKATDTAARS